MISAHKFTRSGLLDVPHTHIMTTTAPLEKIVSGSLSATSSPEHQGSVYDDVTTSPIATSSKPPSWSMKHPCRPVDIGQDDKDGSPHPLVSKASHGSSSTSHHHSPPTPPTPRPKDAILVSGRSNQSPISAVKNVSRGPAQSPSSGEGSDGEPSPLTDPKEWYHRSAAAAATAASPWPLTTSPVSPTFKNVAQAGNNSKSGEIVRFQPSPVSGGVSISMFFGGGFLHLSML